jgi:hypothetical protein
VPAAAVIRRVQALSGITGRKACVGGALSEMRNPAAQPYGLCFILACLRMAEASGTSSVAVKCVDITKNTNGEGSLLGHT